MHKKLSILPANFQMKMHKAAIGQHTGEVKIDYILLYLKDIFLE